MIHDFIPRGASESLGSTGAGRVCATFAVTFGLLALLVGGCLHDSGNSGNAAGPTATAPAETTASSAPDLSERPAAAWEATSDASPSPAIEIDGAASPAFALPGLGDPEKADLSRAPDQPAPNQPVPDQRVLDQLAADTRPARTGSRPAPTNNASRSAPVARQGGGNEWTGFRGPGGLGLGEARGLPAEWSENNNLVWKTELPGAGASSPVFYGEHIYLTAHTGFGVDENAPGQMSDLKRWLICLDRANGRILWQSEAPSQLPETDYARSRVRLHGFASSTPAVDADAVYCFFGKSGVVAFDHQGKQLWHAEVGDQTHDWGSAASPVLHGDLVIVNAFVESGDLIGLNRKSGAQVWRTRGLKETWNTPLLTQAPDGQTELIVGVFGAIKGYDPQTGQELWHCKGMDWYIVGSMVAHDGVIYYLSGKGVEATMAIRAGGRGDISNTDRVIWRARKGSNVSSPIYHDGHLYFAHESQAIAYCLDAATGELKYEERLPRMGEIYASPVIADGKLYYVSREGGTAVLAASPRFEVLGRNRFEGDRSLFNASPAVADNRLFIRSSRYLYCIGQQ